MMKKWKRLLGALAIVFTVTAPAALGVDILANGTPLSAEESWVKNGVSYITLRALARVGDQSLSWDGTHAHLVGGGLTMSGRPGSLYVLANQRPLFLPGGVQVVDGKMALPLRTVAQATGGTLTWNAATSTAALTTKGATPPTASYNQEDLYWLSRVIFSESQGEPLLGQIAVGQVVLNRVKSEQYPNTVREVVFDTNYGVQFEPVSNGTIYHEPNETAILAAKLALEGADVVGDCMYFFAPALSAGTWIVTNRTYYTSIQNHAFYR